MPAHSPKLIAYYLVNDASKLDFDKQREKIQRHARETKSNLIAEFSEYLNDAPGDFNELRKAVDACKTHEAKLAFAAFDDMPRKFRFIVTILSRGVDCVVIREKKSNSYVTELSKLIGEFWR